MDESVRTQILEYLSRFAMPLAIAGAIVGLLLLFVVARKILRRRPDDSTQDQLGLSIDLSALSATGPANEDPRLELYGTQVRVAIVVVAPVGREGEIPPRERLPELIDHVIPGLMNIVARDQPLVRFWPAQLSSQGFQSSFFNNIALPGDRGKGTPWCSAAGKFTALGGQFLAGIVCCAAADNGLGQFAVQHEGQWNDALRVRSQQ